MIFGVNKTNKTKITIEIRLDNIGENVLNT